MFLRWLSRTDICLSLWCGQVVDLRWSDEVTPSLEDLRVFCTTVDEWLLSDRHNVVAVHCLVRCREASYGTRMLPAQCALTRRGARLAFM